MNLQTSEKSEMVCGICGNSHKTSNCTTIQMTTYVEDSILLSKARLTLPNILQIQKMSEGSDIIVAANSIRKGTQFGPFEAKKLFTLSPEIIFPLKLFTPNDYFSEYYLDTSNENECNWMMFVPPAHNLEEQNLICFQDNLKIYFMSNRDIAVGELLKVWYSPYYAQKMNKEVLMSSVTSGNEILISDLNALLKKQQNLMERDLWTCKFCNLQEKDVTRFATHISHHYSMQVRKACEICKAVFLTHKGLKKHVRIVHMTKSIVPINEGNDSAQTTRGKSNIKDMMLGGPLLNDVLSDSMDNTNLLLQQTDISRFDMQTIEKNVLLDSDNLNLSVENFIQDTDNFNFNIDEDKEQHICDICLKPFSKLKRLVQHLQKHTGKYTCSECLVIFSRNENLQAHRCNSHKKEQYKCMVCEKMFSLKKYLSRHFQSVHGKKRQCKKCDKSYHSDKEFRDHNCAGTPETEKEKYPCLLCNKTFFRESYIKKHMKLHAAVKKTAAKTEIFICEICAKTFHSSRNLNRHKNTHSRTTSYSCSRCDKSYTRLDSLRQHVVLEHTSVTFSCPVCEKVCRTKKYLRLHMTMHSSRKKFQCTACNKKFFQKSNLSKHFKTKHAIRCSKCNQEDCEHVKTVVECYECPICQKMVKLRSSILRHIKTSHPQQQVDSSQIKKIRRMWHVPERKSNAHPFEKNVKSSENKNAVQNKGVVRQNKYSKDFNHTFREDLANLQQSINTKRIDNIVVDGNMYGNDAESSKNDQNIIRTTRDNTLDFNDLRLELDAGMAINNQEICLSMPELSDIDQGVTLSDNAYLLDNGTIVEPVDSENVVVYIFDEK